MRHTKRNCKVVFKYILVNSLYFLIIIIIIIIILFRHRLNIIYINNSVYSLHREKLLQLTINN